MTESNISFSSNTRQTSMASASVVDTEQATCIQTTTISIPSTAVCTGAATAAVNGTSTDRFRELPCQWVGCNETFFTAEALYVSSLTDQWSTNFLTVVATQEHICEWHIGRKTANNLILACQWRSCNAIAAKRYHITSHVRIHVPFKPHKCHVCDNSYKRPRDSKEHVKTDVNDSEIPSPELDRKHPDKIFPSNRKL
ncbi:pH-response transcription factor pacC [Penicillium cosmopolitanum]|uniref:pH-response transcription factor pacC/RIM101 n=1 Tax=Penicillium cosmopolitanum TaxID=1131564 RepID=A0A9W9SJ89_9EURO|nr:pH-response transcription factor pacC [Penicillium cosmopolitanum]KAJ5379626.1 pH-response transcription factor pacC [Penicillium cosmopolitanum]